MGSTRNTQGIHRKTYAQKDLSEDDIVLVLEVDGVDDRHAILALRGNEGALLTTIRDVQDLVDGLSLVDLLEHILEGLSIDVALQQSETLCKLIWTPITGQMAISSQHKLLSCKAQIGIPITRN